MVTPVLVAVSVPQIGDDRRKNWAKVVHAVDDSKATGWAFEGEFIATGGIQDVPIGSVVLVYGEKGSRANPHPLAEVFVANGDGTLSHQAAAKGKAWARTLRDEVAELLDAGEMKQSGLATVPDEVLIEELERRGFEVTAS